MKSRIIKGSVPFSLFFSKSSQPKAKRALHDIWQTATHHEAERAFDSFLAKYESKYPKATTYLLKDRELLLTF